MSKKKEQPKITYLDILTEVELETESPLIFSLCETVRGVEISEGEMATLGSFLQWLRENTNGHKQEEPNDQGLPIEGEVKND